MVVQYDKDLLEVWDEAKRLRCEWFNDYEKTASKPPMVIADLDVVQLDFRGTFSLWLKLVLDNLSGSTRCGSKTPDEKNSLDNKLLNSLTRGQGR